MPVSYPTRQDVKDPRRSDGDDTMDRSTVGAGDGAGSVPTRAYRPEIARRMIQWPSVPHAPGASGRESAKSEHHRKLIVGQGIHLAGDISACEHLIVHGIVEANLTDCKRIEVIRDGVFKGSADIDEAIIGGHFDGDLKVRGMLRLRGTGVVSGSVQYGELTVETGGQLRGTSEPTETALHALPEPKGGRD